MGNVSVNAGQPFEAEPGECVWKTRRLGTVAYDINGRRIVSLRPTFIKKSEALARGYEIVPAGG